MSPLRSSGLCSRENESTSDGSGKVEADRRSDGVRDRVQDDLRSGVKAGVATTPTLFAAGERQTSPLDLAALERLIQQPS